MSDTNTSKTRTITLTDRPPVTIREADWPIIAEGWSYDGCPQSVRCQSREAHLRVRQHADGRTIVSATYISPDARPDWRGGVLIGQLGEGPAMSAIVAAIHDVADQGGISDRIVRECIADLPAEELT